MAKLHRIDSGNPHSAPTFFSRRELQQLLDLYSRGVARGEWRDYAIDQRGNSAVFSIFRHTHEHPLFSIAKRADGGEYVVHSGPQRLARASSLPDALSVLKKRRTLHVVK
ncbi:DUF2794 domain-containing protein [Ferruginivarius sediminum]|uniref:DUF2794 domain-containing protein n=1 Tax=Ferruginivarius sediminum TaxID=2661937 RepID=A0A369TDZ7_9PROT|nr:DUF2794 domain-containing protein [Ferruginivarius sediminum]RDD62595.1 DUF2794 domain-containing protein [Ferruginivarius sediminum]